MIKPNRKRRLRLFIGSALLLLFSVAASFFYLSALGVKFDRSLLKTAMGIPAPKATQRGLADHVSVPLDFGIEVHAGLVPGARMMAVTERGDLIVSSPREGKVFIVYKDDLGEVLVKPLLRSLNYPHGLDIHEGWLYVAESGGVSRIKFDAQRRSVIGEVKPIINGLPEGGNHRTKTIKFGPDGFLYLSVGSSCNVCVEEDKRRATIMRYNADGSGEEVFASGLRNSVGFDWSLQDSRLYATDNGRDLLGDDFPPCELNQIEKGNFYGWPYANGAKILDPDLGEGKDILVQGSIAPVHEFRAHNAPLGMAFIAGKTLPKNYQGAALVALHGSWNRRERDGYKVVSLHWKKDGSIVEKDFVAGFHDGDTILARPVDVVEGHDGTIYISDDYAGAIYKVRYFQP